LCPLFPQGSHVFVDTAHALNAALSRSHAHLNLVEKGRPAPRQHQCSCVDNRAVRVARWHRSWQRVVAKFKEVVFPRQLIKENEASCLVIRIGNWSETCQQHIPMLLCAFWRWGAVLHVNIIVSIGIKLASGKMEEIAIFISNQNKILPPCDGRIQRYRTRNQRAQSVCQLVDRGVSLDPQHPNFLPPESHWVLGATYHTHQKE